jgi:tRNA (guanine10-N2)-methyltransferase
VSAAKFGSYVIGTDIDFMMLMGRSKPSRVNQKVRAKDECIKANMIQYNLQHLYLDVCVADFSNCPLKDSIRFDSIITDREYKR